MNQQLTITFVAHRVGPVGGMERAMYELARGLLARGHGVRVIARHCDLAPSPGLEWIRVRGPERPASVAEPWFLLVGSWLVARKRRGLVHVLGALVASGADLATVQFCHHAFQHGFRDPRRRRDTLLFRVNEWFMRLFSRSLERWAYPRTRHLVPVSRGVASELKQFLHVADDRMTVIPNGVDSGEFGPDERVRNEVRRQLGMERELLAGFVGGDWARKGLTFAIDALPDAPEWDLVVVGSGDQESYAAQARQLGVLDRVHFLGHRSDPARYFAALDAFVLPTAYEAHPLVVLEAAASGAPLLVTAVNGVSDFLKDGENGLLIERDGGTVAAALGRLAASAEERQRLSRAAIALAASFSWDRVVDGYERLYGEVAASKVTG